MRKAFFLSFVVNLVLLGVSLAIGPSQVAISFGFDGSAPNKLEPAHVYASIMGVVNCIVFLTFWFYPTLIRKRWLPEVFINIPNKNYCLSDENREQAALMLSQEMYLIGTVIFIFMFIVELLAFHANLSTPIKMRMDLAWPTFGLFIAFTIYWIIRISRKFKIPEKPVC